MANKRDKTGPAATRGPGGSASQAGSRKRATAAPIKKPFPWGFAAGVTVLVLVLGGILGYAVVNTGSGFTTALDKADKGFTGLQKASNLSANHVTTLVSYPDKATLPPDGGNHNPYPQTCMVYTAPIVDEHAVHSMEHGAVWITYRPGLPADQVATLAGQVTGNDYRMLSPFPGLVAPITVQAWGRRIEAQTASDPQIGKFLDTYTDGPQTREKGASCSGVTETGTKPFVVNAAGTGFVEGDATTTVPYRGTVPSGAAGSAAPGSTPSAEPTNAPAPAVSGTVPVPTSPGKPATTPTPAGTPAPVG